MNYILKTFLLVSLLMFQVNANESLDTDSDGVSDSQEAADGSDPNDYFSILDTDGDGVPDVLESQYGEDINMSDAKDSDGDGVIDYVESFPGANNRPSISHNELGYIEKSIDIGISDNARKAIYFDYDQDDDLDVIYSERVDNGSFWKVAENCETELNCRVFEITEITSDAFFWQGVSIDWNLDGYNDLVVATSDDELVLYENCFGSLTCEFWEPFVISKSAKLVTDLKVLDVDLDGDLDIVVVINDFDVGKVLLVENQEGAWVESFIYDNTSSRRFDAIETGDFNGDGYLDLVIVNNFQPDPSIELENNFEILENCFGETICKSWQRGLVYTFDNYIHELQVIDIDNDGDLDVIAEHRLESNYQQFFWIENCLNEPNCLTWKSYSYFDAKQDYKDFAFADLNRDGMIEIMGYSHSSKVSIFEGCGFLSDCKNEMYSFSIDEMDGFGVFDFVDTHAGVSKGFLTLKTFESKSVRLFELLGFDTSILETDIKHNTTTISLPITASDADGQDLTYSLSGTDASIFVIDPITGEITYPDGLDYDNPQDVGFDNRYEFYLIVSDGELSDSIAITLNVQSNVDSDLDGVVDYLEVNAGTDPNDKTSYLDSDRDLVPDELESQFGGEVDVADAKDTDGDGVIDYLEQYSGLNDAPVWLSLEAPFIEPTDIELAISMVEGREYVLFEYGPRDDDGDDITITLEGDDASLITYSEDGRFTPVSLFDYLAPNDLDRDNILNFRLVATDGNLSSTLSISLTITRNGTDNDNDGVLDVDEISQGTDRNDPFSFLDTDGDGVPDSLESYFGHDINVSDALDSDNDGVIDYVELFSGENDPPFWFAEQGNFTSFIETELAAEADISAVGYNDFNFDGYMDVILFDANTSIISVLFNTAGQFTQRTLEVTVSAVDAFYNLGANRQGQPKILVLDSQGELHQLTYDVVRDTFSLQALPMSQGQVDRVMTADVDSDGDVDVVYTTTGNHIGWLENVDHFTEAVIRSASSSIVDFQVGDLNGDNQKDLVVVEQNRIYWLDKSRDWQKVEIELAAPLAVVDIALADMDNDADVDVAILHDVGNNQSISWIENGGNWKAHAITSNANADVITLSDVDVDGFTDIVVTGSSVEVFWQSTMWSKETLYQFNDQIFDLALHDVDLDSDVDFIIRQKRGNSGQLFVMTNDELIKAMSLELVEGTVGTGLTLDAFDADGNTVLFSLEGKDKSLFEVSNSGTVSLIAPIDFVANQSNVYNISVIASDGEYSDIVDITLSIISSIDTDNDGVIDYLDLDDDNDLVPDLIEYRDGSNALSPNDFLDVDNNGEADFIQQTEFNTSISYQFSLAAEVDEGGFTVIDLHNVSSPNGAVVITAESDDELTLSIENAKLFIYAGFINETVESTVILTLDDGVHNTTHTLPVKVMDVVKGEAKVELIKEQLSTTDEIRLMVQSFNFNDSDFTIEWYLDGEPATASLGNGNVITIQSNQFQGDRLRVKVRLYNINTGELFADQLELLQTELSGPFEGDAALETENKALSLPLVLVWFCAFLVLLKRRLRTLISISAVFAMTGCVSLSPFNTETEVVKVPVEKPKVKDVTLSFGMDDPLYAQMKAKEKAREKARVEEEKRQQELAAKAKVKKLHMSNLGF